MFKKLRTISKTIQGICSLFALVVLTYWFFWGSRAEKYFDKGYEYYEKGDWRSAIAEWKNASEAGDPLIDLLDLAKKAAHKAEFNLGLVYTKGEHGIVENYQEAAKWYGLAAEGGMPEAQFNLGILYLNGQGVPRNPDKGVEWLKKSARQGLKEAKDTLAELGIYDYDN